MTLPVSTTASTRAVLSSGVGLAMEQAPLLIVGDPGLPTTATDGLGVRAGLLAAVMECRCRIDVSRRRAWGVVSTVASSEDYRVTIGPDDVTYTSGGSDDEAAILDGLRLAIEADATLDALVEAVVLASGPAGNVPHLLVLGRDDTDWTVLFDVDGGSPTGAMDTYAEPSEMEVDVYGRPISRVPSSLVPSYYGSGAQIPGWGILSGASGPIVDLAMTLGGITERVDVSGIGAITVRPHDYAGPTGEDPSVEYVPFVALHLGVE